MIKIKKLKWMTPQLTHKWHRIKDEKYHLNALKKLEASAFDRKSTANQG